MLNDKSKINNFPLPQCCYRNQHAKFKIVQQKETDIQMETHINKPTVYKEKINLFNMNNTQKITIIFFNH